MTGLRQYNPATGQIILDTSNAGIAKVLGVFDTTNSAGSLSDNRLRAGVGFIFPVTPYSNSGMTRTFAFNDNVLSWSSSANNVPSRFAYGVGRPNNPNYVSTRAPGTPGFIIRDANGNFSLDNTFFTQHFIGKISGTFPGGIGTFDIPHAYDDLPLYAMRSDGYVTPIGGGRNGSQNYLILSSAAGTPINIDIYFFATIDRAPRSLSSGIGARWWIGGTLAGDTSIPFLNLFETGVWSGSLWGGPDRYVGGLVAGRRYATMIHSPGQHVQVFGSGGSTGSTIQISCMAGRVQTAGGQDYVSFAERQTQQTTGGGGPSNTFVDGLYSVVDVTGF